MASKRVHILTAVNAGQISKSGDTYTIANVCGAVDGIVMNGMLYPGDQLAAGAPTMEGKPAPAGHPKDKDGRYISALNGEALLNAYIGSVCTHARHEGGRTLTDVVVNGKQAAAHPDGARLVERLEAAITGTDTDPIHVSTGLLCEVVNASGESLGKKYDRIATNIRYDHLAILLDQKGAGTPEDGVGMFLNAAGQAEEVEAASLDLTPQDKRYEGLKGWLHRLLGNGADLSFDQIHEGLRALLPNGDVWIREVFARYFVWVDYAADKLFKQDYAIGSDGSLALTSDPVEVRREVTYEPVSNLQERADPVKDKILAALNAAGIKTEGLDDGQLLTAYNALVVKPVQDQLTAANAKVAEFEAAATAAQNAERDALAAELAVNSSLTVEDLKLLPLDRLKALKTNAKAAPVVVGKSGDKQSEFAGYSLNAILEPAK